MGFVYVNFFDTVLTAAVDAAATSIGVASLGGLTLAGNARARLTLGAGAVREIVEVTAITGNVLTVVRGVEGTTPAAWDVGSRIIQAQTAEQLRGLQPKIEPSVVVTSPNLSIQNGGVQELTLTANADITLDLVNGQVLVLYLNPVTFTATFPSNLKWSGGTIGLIPNKVHTLVFTRNSVDLRCNWEVDA